MKFVLIKIRDKGKKKIFEIRNEEAIVIQMVRVRRPFTCLTTYVLYIPVCKDNTIRLWAVTPYSTHKVTQVYYKL